MRYDAKLRLSTSNIDNNRVDLDSLFSKIGNFKKIGRNVKFYYPDGSKNYFVRVLHGALRTVSFFEDGRRQVGEFYLTGETFGFDVVPGSFSAEAVIDTEYVFMSRVHVMELAVEYPALARELLQKTAESLHRTRERMLLLGRQTAEERLENFLIDMARRIGNGTSVDLPMDRRDIADYLALAIETVSRTFSELERKERIETRSSRRIYLSDCLEERSSPQGHATAPQLHAI